MNGSVLLDTNIVIKIFNRDAAILEKLIDAEDVKISIVVLGELYFGAFKSSHVAGNLDRIRDLMRTAAILTCDATTAAHYGELKQALHTKGTPIPENDLWIAATAVQYGMTLITRDRHFEHIDGLAIQQW